MWSLFIAEMAMGQLVGYIIASPLIDRFGRRWSIVATNALQIPFQLCHILARPLGLWQLLYVGRGGSMLAFAVAAVAVPVYLNEIAPPAHRGSLGTCFPLSLSLGALLVLSIPLLLSLPDSPVFLAGEGRAAESRAALLFFHGSESEYAATAVESRREGDGGRKISTASRNSLLEGSRAMLRLLRKRSLRGPMLLTLSISVTFTFSGIAVVSAYSTAIIAESGLGWASAEYCTVGLKLLSFSTYVLCLVLVDKLGRRVLMLSSVTGSAVAWSVLVGSGWFPAAVRPVLSTALIFVAQFFMNVGIRPLFYVLVPELFPFRFRTAGKSLAALLGVLMAIPVLFTFWPLLKVLGWWVFLVQAVPLWLALAYLASALPETKGRSSNEIFAELRISSTKRRQFARGKDPRPLKPMPVAV